MRDLISQRGLLTVWPMDLISLSAVGYDCLSVREKGDQWSDIYDLLET